MAKEKTKERRKRSKRKQRKLKRKQAGGLCILFWQCRIRARGRTRKAAALHMHLPRGGRGCGGDRRQLLCTESDLALWVWYCRHFDRRRILDRAYYYASCQQCGEARELPNSSRKTVI